VRAQIVERVVSTGMFAPRQHKGVDHRSVAIGGLAARFSSAFRKAMSHVVSLERRIADER
jgi:hypothetical protein